MSFQEESAYPTPSRSCKKISMIRLLLLAFIPLAVIGCAHTHSTPLTSEPNKVRGKTMEAWVDQDGTFYPTRWKNKFIAPDKVRGHYSLVRMAEQGSELEVQGKRQMLADAEKLALAEYRDFIADKNRIFIFVHGYNNSEDEAKVAYNAIRDVIDFKKRDGVVEFYWDGLNASGVRGGRIWFNATGYSQLAGTRGLRKMLNVTRGKEVIFITHSRGASVLLSALSDPPYNNEFLADTERPQLFKVYGTPALKNNGNRISAILIAPAIDLIDFESPNYAPAARMRKFDGQLTRVYHTVNSRDPVLNKFVGLPTKLNPTSLGLRVSTAETINGLDGRFGYKQWNPPMRSHKFVDYVQDSQFRQMLREMRIDVKAPAQTVASR